MKLTNQAGTREPFSRLVCSGPGRYSVVEAVVAQRSYGGGTGNGLAGDATIGGALYRMGLSTVRTIVHIN